MRELHDFVFCLLSDSVIQHKFSDMTIFLKDKDCKIQFDQLAFQFRAYKKKSKNFAAQAVMPNIWFAVTPSSYKAKLSIMFYQLTNDRYF